MAIKVFIVRKGNDTRFLTIEDESYSISRNPLSSRFKVMTPNSINVIENFKDLSLVADEKDLQSAAKCCLGLKKEFAKLVGKNFWGKFAQYYLAHEGEVKSNTWVYNDLNLDILDVKYNKNK